MAGTIRAAMATARTAKIVARRVLGGVERAMLGPALVALDSRAPVVTHRVRAFVFRSRTLLPGRPLLLVFVEGADDVSHLATSPAVVVVSMDTELARELRQRGIAGVRLLADYARTDRSFDTLFHDYQAAVHAKFRPSASPMGDDAVRVFDRIEPDVIRQTTWQLYLRDLVRIVLEQERPSHVAIRARDPQLASVVAAAVTEYAA